MDNQMGEYIEVRDEMAELWERFICEMGVEDAQQYAKLLVVYLCDWLNVEV